MDNHIVSQHEYIIVVKTPDARAFARAVWELEERGCKPQMGQALFFDSGFHVAYYLDPEKLPPEPVAAEKPKGGQPAPVLRKDVPSPPDAMHARVESPGGYA